jgi:Amt family ammonium transporter
MVDGMPEYVLAMFQGKFAIITPALISGASAERVYFRGYSLFIVLWFLLIYCLLCHWVWACGLVIHVSAGISALVAALFLGRKDFHERPWHPIILS